MTSARPNILAFLFLAGALLLAGGAMAAEKGAGAGQTVSTKYFSVVIPAGWEMVRPVRNAPRGVMAIFANRKANIAVELSVLDSTLTAKDMAETTVKDLRAKKLDADDPVEDGKFYTFEVQGAPMPYRCWVGANGKFAGVTTVMGTNIRAANSFLRAVRADQPDTFPTGVPNSGKGALVGN